MGALDRLARSWAETQIRDRTEAHYPGSRAMARIRAPRFLRALIGRGTVSDIEASLFETDVGDVRLRRLTVELHEVRVSRTALLRGRVRLRDLGSGSVEAVLDGPSLARAVRLPLVFHDDEVEIRQSMGPLAVSARGSLTVDENVLRFRPGTVQGVPLPVSADFQLPLPTSPVWPRAASVRSIEGALVLTCDLDDVPPGLIDVTEPRLTSLGRRSGGP